MSGFLGRLLGVSRVDKKNISSGVSRGDKINVPSGETRAAVTTDTVFTYSQGWPNNGFVSVQAAENLSAVAAAVGVISGSMATLPPLVYQMDGTNRVENTSHPVARLIRQPNENQNWPDFIEWLMASVLLHGNALAEIQYDGAGRPVALSPIPWPSVNVRVLASGRLAFDVRPSVYSVAGTTTRRIFPSECFWLRDRSDDGVVGRSRISRAPQVLSNAAALQDFVEATWKNGASPSGAFRVPAAMNKDSFDKLRAQLKERTAGTHNARTVLLLDNGAEWQSMSMDLESAEILESRKFSITDIARLFNVPVMMLQEHSNSTFTNSEQNARFFATATLQPWVTKVEAEARRSLFGGNPNFSLELDMTGLTRGDPAQRWSGYDIALKHQVLDVNEVRQAEGFNARKAQPKPEPAPVPEPQV